LWVCTLIAVAPPAAAAPKPSPFEGDARLEKKVTVRWSKANLQEAVQEVQHATGVTLRVDSAVMDEPVMASARDVPARAVLEQVARLTHYTWLRQGGTEEKPGYRIFQDRAAQLEEQAEIDGARQQVLQALQKELQRYRQLSQLPPDRLQQEVDRADQELSNALSGGLMALGSNPAMAERLQEGQAVRAVASPIGRAMLDLLDTIQPEQWRQMEDDDTITFATRPAAGDLPLPTSFEERLRNAKPGFPFPKAVLKTLAGEAAENALGQAETMLQDGWSQAESFRVTVQLTLDVGAQPVGMLRATPEPVRSDAGASGAVLGPLSM